jgi:hypothetical protein
MNEFQVFVVGHIVAHVGRQALVARHKNDELMRYGPVGELPNGRRARVAQWRSTLLGLLLG